MKPLSEMKKEAVRDFYGQYSSNAKVLMKYLIKTNKPKLTEEQKEDLWFIQKNLLDPIYRKELRNSIGI